MSAWGQQPVCGTFLLLKRLRSQGGRDSKQKVYTNYWRPRTTHAFSKLQELPWSRDRDQRSMDDSARRLPPRHNPASSIGAIEARWIRTVSTV